MLGDVSGIRELYAELFDSLKDRGCSSPSTIHGFLSDETACVCRSYISLFKRNRELKEKVDRLKEDLWSAFSDATAVGILF